MSRHYHMIEYIYEDAEALRRTLDDNEAVIERISAHVFEDQIKRVII